MESLPFELAEIIFGNLPFDTILVIRLVSRQLNSLVVACYRSSLQKPDSCEIERLKIRRYGWIENGPSSPLPSISFRTRLYNSNSILHFEGLREHFIRAIPLIHPIEQPAYHGYENNPFLEPALWKGWRTRRLNHLEGRNRRREIHFTLKYPPTQLLKDQFPLFESARIKHFEISKKFPLFLKHDDSIERLMQLFKGCDIEKTTLLFDSNSLAKIWDIPKLLNSFKSRSVHFYLAGCEKYDMFKPFHSPIFATELVAAGIEEVVFEGVGDTRMQKLMHLGDDHPIYGMGKPFFNFAPIIVLMNAGITQINVLPNTLENKYAKLEHKQLDSFIDSVSNVDKPVNIRLCMGRCSNLVAGKYECGANKNRHLDVKIIKTIGGRSEDMPISHKSTVEIIEIRTSVIEDIEE